MYASRMDGVNIMLYIMLNSVLIYYKMFNIVYIWSFCLRIVFSVNRRFSCNENIPFYNSNVHLITITNNYIEILKQMV